jgi:hypothetical protein
MRLIYTGPLGAVRIPLPNGREVEAQHDDVVEVPDDIGEGLLEQADNWKRAPGGQRVIKSADELDAEEEATE